MIKEEDVYKVSRRAERAGSRIRLQKRLPRQYRNDPPGEWAPLETSGALPESRSCLSVPKKLKMDCRAPLHRNFPFPQPCLPTKMTATEQVLLSLLILSSSTGHKMVCFWKSKCKDTWNTWWSALGPPRLGGWDEGERAKGHSH